MQRLYFAHPINSYNTELEDWLLKLIKAQFQDWEIENPNQQKHQDGYQTWRQEKENGMLYFTEEVLPKCQGAILLPFRDGQFGAGVAKEAQCFFDNDLPVWELIPLWEDIPGFAIRQLTKIDEGRILSIEETRSRLRDADGNPLPY